MIKLKCSKCGADMEVPDSMAGHTEACPECKTVNIVSQSKEIPQGPDAREPLAPGLKLSEPWGRFCGWLLIVLGIGIIIGFSVMDVSSGYSFGERGIANLDKMNQRLGGMILGVGVFLSGVVKTSVGGMEYMLWKVARLWVSQMSDALSAKRATEER